MTNEIAVILKELPKSNLINVLERSLALMQEHPIRTIEYCILTAIGATTAINQNNMLEYELPDLSTIIDLTTRE